MNEKLRTTASSRLILDARTASDLMTPGPMSLPADATVHEAAAFLTDRGFSAAPVIDKTGRPAGVLSHTDIVIHDRESGCEFRIPDSDERENAEEACPAGFHVERPDPTRVRDIMTPVVFSVAPDAPAGRVVEDMLALRVHRLFVVDADGVLMGVISALDVLKHLCTEQPELPDRVSTSPANRSAYACEPW